MNRYQRAVLLTGGITIAVIQVSRMLERGVDGSFWAVPIGVAAVLLWAGLSSGTKNSPSDSSPSKPFNWKPIFRLGVVALGLFGIYLALAYRHSVAMSPTSAQANLYTETLQQREIRNFPPEEIKAIAKARLDNPSKPCVTPGNEYDLFLLPGGGCHLPSKVEAKVKQAQADLLENESIALQKTQDCIDRKRKARKYNSLDAPRLECEAEALAGQ